MINRLNEPILIENYAPLIITVYTRESNLRKLIDSLLTNPEVKYTDVYIISDGAGRNEDKDAVTSVRNYMKSISGFRNVNLIMPEKNSRAINQSHVKPVIMQLLEKYGKYIYVEDDHIVSKWFLRFMNEALEFYKDDPRICSISSYQVPIKIPFWYKKCIYVCQRFSPWGCAYTANWYKEINRDYANRYPIAILPENIKKFKNLGNDILEILKLDSEKKINATDIRVCYHQVMNNKYTIFPTVSMIKTTGFDGTGEHCGNDSNKYDVVLYNKEEYDIKFIKDIKPNSIILRRFKNFWNKKPITVKERYNLFMFYFKTFIKKVLHIQ